MSSFSKSSSGHQAVPAPRAARDLNMLLTSFARDGHAVMSPWQLYGFGLALVSVLPEQSWDASTLDADLLYDFIDEALHSDEEQWDEELDPDPLALLESPSGSELTQKACALLEGCANIVSEQNGPVALAFLEGKNAPFMPAAVECADGMVRGILFGIDDEEEIEKEEWGEILSLLFLLTEETPEVGFGTPAERAEARKSVAAALPGLLAGLRMSGLEDEAEE